VRRRPARGRVGGTMNGMKRSRATHVAVAALLLLLFAGGAYAATVVTELHPYSKTYTERVTVGSKGKQQVVTIVGTVSGTITDQDTYPDPVTVTQTVTVGGTTSTQVTTTAPTTGHGTTTAPTTTAPTTTTVPPPPPSGDCTTTVSPDGTSNTLNAAYQAAVPNDVVCLGSGSYGTQKIGKDFDKPEGVGMVTFRPAPGSTPLLEQLQLGNWGDNLPGPRDIIVEELAINYVITTRAACWAGSCSDTPRPQNILLQRIQAKAVDILHSDGVTVQDSDLRGCVAASGNESGSACMTRTANSSFVTFQRNLIHDAVSADPVNWHIDGMFIMGATDVKVLDNKFYRNMVTNIRIQTCCQNRNNERIHIEGNWFAAPFNDLELTQKRANAIDIDDPRFTPAIPGLKILRNSFGINTRPYFAVLDDGCCNVAPQPGAEIAWNIMQGTPSYSICAPQANEHDNALTQRPGSGSRLCGPGDFFIADPMYVNPDDRFPDFRLMPGSPATGYGSELGG
jgi:hypothetical protein